MIVGEYEQRMVYERYNGVDNGSDSVHKTSGVIYRVNWQIQQVFYGRDEPYFVCTHRPVRKISELFYSFQLP